MKKPTAHFRQLVDDLRTGSHESFRALVAHIGACSTEGFCPVCSSPMKPPGEFDAKECLHGPGCIHGTCMGCEHVSHFDPSRTEQETNPEGVRQVWSILNEMIRLMDAGHHVRFVEPREDGYGEYAPGR